jgi:hypothetical protein
MDGQVILIVADDDVFCAYYEKEVTDDFHWVFLDPRTENKLNAYSTKRWPPTHWQPLPSLPKGTK